MANRTALNGIEYYEWWEEEDPLSLFPAENPAGNYVIRWRRAPLRLRMRRFVPAFAGVASAAFVAAVTLATLNEVRRPVIAPAESVATPVAEDQTLAVPLPASVPAQVERRSSSTDVDRSEAVRPPVQAVPREAAPRQAAIELRARQSAPLVVAESPRTRPVDVLASAAETLRTPILPSEAATSGVADVETPSRPAAPPATTVVAALGTAPASVAVAPAVPAPSPGVAAPVVQASTAIESVLDRYELAFSMLDAQRAKTVWPGVNQRNLERAFDSLEKQEFDLGSCNIAVTPPRAVATCDGNARYVPKVGTKAVRSERRRWTFRLQQSGPNWSIESVDTQ